ncbi:hypothetical protein ABFS82_06G189700 [Erythranthe guttata]|uniref:GATA transcription factor 8-like n=1 Tax=Erythranthe guttata TaxID=4155 RepID=UPI00064D937B|nr:PREDICTED: GATA transcription factor 8-like [Erythranthe guttata]XP_012834749.1 PREDICTED: GATA transcription factor 8-like [Erythranthe guttata]XP_012834750.1 PREDICTED: GATA transcription factor 8-like [Erythranthe guttata]XP_012834752.1 PREDICTED: GATA transcription factor 8-like [Erythranthe guttata]|eukprot:XP_012834748.1 PREDICTED: GATA transcription factor 8-like [Erythranthe guttata]
MGPNFMDEIDCGNFFDQIDDLIEFPPDNECGEDSNLVISSDVRKDFPAWNNDLPDCDPLFSGSHVSSASDLSAELSVPYEDIVQLEWLSNFMEDSFSCKDMTIGKQNSSVPHNQFQTSSPVSVLESSSSSNSTSSSLSPTHRGPQRARSKRARPASFNPRAAIQLISPSPEPNHNFIIESPPVMKKAHKPKPKKIKETPPVDPLSANDEYTPPGQALRKCLHCEITKTPQWRAGPLGPKTLCNACGVRYKSGRLFPEYRPAASPTFVPSVHSNSHKKVLEMRNTVEPENGASGPGPITSASL